MNSKTHPQAWINQIASSLLGNQEALTSLTDVTTQPRAHQEVERKYLLGKPGQDISLIETRYMHEVTGFVTRRKFRLESAVTFAGIDQYFRARTKKIRLDARYRTGMNRGPEVTLKCKTGATCDIRTEIPMKVSGTRPESVQALFSVLFGAIDPRTKVFTLRCVGNIWTLIDTDRTRVEIVIYRYCIVGRPDTEHVFLEIESLDVEDPNDALNQVKRFESLLAIGKLRIDRSVADIFGDLVT